MDPADTPAPPTARRAGLSTPLRAAILIIAVAALMAASLVVGARWFDDTPATPSETSVDAGFARDMQFHHGQAVEMSVMVRDTSADPQVRQLALDILLTQQQQSGQMYSWLVAWGLHQSGIPMAWMSGEDSGNGEMPGMDHANTPGTADLPGIYMPIMDMPGMATEKQVDRLRSLRGQLADRYYLQLMITHHQGGVAMAEYVVENAVAPQVVQLARSMLNSQSAELKVLGDMLDQRGGPLSETNP